MRLVCESITDDDKGVELTLREQVKPEESQCRIAKRIKVLFDPVVAYRNVDESYRTRTFDNHRSREGALFIVQNSEWISWLHSESYGMYEGARFTHYAIFTLNDCIDVVSEFEPSVSWI